MSERAEFRDKVAVVGIGSTDFSSNSGRSELQLAAEAIKAAAEDAGLPIDAIDGIVQFSIDQAGTPPTVAAALGLQDLSYWGLSANAGGGAMSVPAHAANALITGQAKYIAGFRSLNGRTGWGRFAGLPSTEVGGRSTYAEFSAPYGMAAPVQYYATIARRHMIEYGTPQEAFGQIAAACRWHASHNPYAQMKQPFTMEEYHNSRWVSEPLHLLDCCLRTDGASAVIMTTADRAKDLRQKPAYLSSWAMAAGPQPLIGYMEPFLFQDTVTTTPSKYLAPKLWSMAGVGPEDMDVAQIYDCFTITVALQLEDYGFCKKGEVADWVGDGSRIRLGGELPINTAGGNLSEGYIHGFNHLLEGVRQIRGTSTCQVPDAAYCLVTGGAPTPTTAVVLHRKD